MGATAQHVVVRANFVVIIVRGQSVGTFDMNNGHQHLALPVTRPRSAANCTAIRSLRRRIYIQRSPPHTIVCVFIPVYLHNLRSSSLVPSANDALRHNSLGLLDCGVLLDLLSLIATANCSSESKLGVFMCQQFSFLLILLAERFHMCNRRLSCCIASFARLALRRFVDDYELRDVSVSLFNVQRRYARIHFRTF